MTNDIVATNSESNSMYTCNYVSNGLNSSMFFNSNEPVKSDSNNSSILCANSHSTSIRNDTHQFYNNNNGIINHRMMPAYYERVSILL